MYGFVTFSAHIIRCISNHFEHPCSFMDNTKIRLIGRNNPFQQNHSFQRVLLITLRVLASEFIHQFCQLRCCGLEHTNYHVLLLICHGLEGATAQQPFRLQTGTNRTTKMAASSPSSSPTAATTLFMDAKWEYEVRNNTHTYTHICIYMSESMDWMVWCLAILLDDTTLVSTIVTN
jgi:hypothetical protein